ncbi:MAG TPA: histidine phosphatase family protein [Anaerolineales bacterium]|nr:histidine phosphatase family protein [Anaerolineales bacterium]
MDLYFIRHGQSENNVLEGDPALHHLRKADPNLTAIGYKQAEQLAIRLATQPSTGSSRGPLFADSQNAQGFGITHLYCSLHLRAIQTAMPTCEALGLPLVAWKLAHEHWGLFQYDEQTDTYTAHPGPSRTYFAEHFPKLVLPEDVGEDGWWKGNREDDAAKNARAKAFYAELLARHGATDDRIALVSHGGFFVSFMRAVFATPYAEESNWFLMNNCAISRLHFSQRGPLLVYANNTQHLPYEYHTY